MTKKKRSEYGSGFEAILYMMTPLRLKMLRIIEKEPRRFSELARAVDANPDTVNQFLILSYKLKLIEEKLLPINGRSKKVYSITTLGKNFLKDFSKYEEIFST